MEGGIQMNTRVVCKWDLQAYWIGLGAKFLRFWVPLLKWLVLENVFYHTKKNNDKKIPYWSMAPCGVRFTARRKCSSRESGVGLFTGPVGEVDYRIPPRRCRGASPPVINTEVKLSALRPSETLRLLQQWFQGPRFQLYSFTLRKFTSIGTGHFGGSLCTSGGPRWSSFSSLFLLFTFWDKTVQISACRYNENLFRKLIWDTNEAPGSKTVVANGHYYLWLM